MNANTVSRTLACFLCTLLLSGCTTQSNSSESGSASSDSSMIDTSAGNTDSAVTVQPLAVSIENMSNIALSDADTTTAWSDSDPTITLNGTSAATTATEGVSIAGSNIRITKGGTYVLSGTLTDGRILVELPDSTEKVHLILNDVTVTSTTSAPLTVLQADKVTLTLADGTTNTFTDAATYTQFDDTEQTEPNACIFAKDDLSINGNGALVVNGNFNNGIQCKNDLRIVSGDITVTSANHGIRGDDSVVVKDGSITITASGDGIKSTTIDETDKGFVDLEGGTINITAAQDGIDAATALIVTGSHTTITSGGGAGELTAQNDMRQGGGRGDWGGMFDDTNESTADTTTSTKGMKAESVVAISGGTIQIDAADDALHSNLDLQLSGDAVLELKSSDDGIHAEQNFVIQDNVALDITQSYEGIEAYQITIAGGTTHVTASDDGLNASGTLTDTTSDASATDSSVAENPFGDRGGMSGFSSSTGILNLNGGYLYVDANGDGLDSNGDITMTAGTVIVNGPTNDGNGPLDCGDRQNTISLTGGTLLALGSTGMMETPDSNYIAATNLQATADTQIVITDESGTVLAAYTTKKQSAGLVFSANGMTDGYQVYTGGSYDGDCNEDGFATGGSYTAGTLITSGSGGGTGGMMNPGGNFGGDGMGGGRGNRDEQMTPSDGGMTPPTKPEDNASAT